MAIVRNPKAFVPGEAAEYVKCIMPPEITNTSQLSEN